MSGELLDIVHVYKDYPPVRGGIEHHLQVLAEEQARRGHRVTVFVSAPRGGAGATLEAGVQVVRLGSVARLRSTPLPPTLPMALHRTTADVTHLHFPYPPGEIAHLLAGRARRTVLTYHSDIVRQRWIGRLYRPVLRRLLARVDRIIVSSPVYRSPMLPGSDQRVVAVPYGVRLAEVTKVDPRVEQDLRRRWPGHRLLFVGRLRYYKGLDHLIRAMDAVPADLLVVGDGPMGRALRSQAAAGPAADRIHFLGDVEPEHLPAHYAAADLLVLPSDRRAEAFGIVQLEAMAVGTPVVSTELGTGTSWVNRDGETGRVVPPGDPNALGAVLAELLAAPAQRREMGARARRRVAERFTADRMTEAVLEVYRHALQEPPPGR